MTKARVFDSVVVDDSGKKRRFPRETFLLLPLRDRVRWILQNRAEFFLGDRPVDAKLALKAISNGAAETPEPGEVE